MFGDGKGIATRFANPIKRGGTGRRLVVSTALLAGVGGSMVISAAPASAAVPGLVRIAAASASNSTSPKSVTVSCPAGKLLVGTGAEITGGLGEVVLDDLRPNDVPAASPTSVLVTAYTEDPYAASWSITGYAICANPVPGLVWISSVSAGGSPDFQSTTATCPAGKSLLGTGFEITGGRGEVVLDDFRPNGGVAAAPTSTTAAAYEADPDYLPNWSITAYAVCANSLAVPGMVRASATNAAGVSPDVASQNVACPAGKVLVGTGAEVNGAQGEVAIDDLRPSGGPAVAPTSNLTTGYETDPNYVPNWTITSYAICASVPVAKL